MTVRTMTRSQFSKPISGSGALYFEEITLTTESESDIIILPLTRMYALTVNIVDFSGDGKVAFTNDSFEKIEADTATYVNWDGVSLINLGVVAFKVTRSTGTITAKVTVKTDTV